jgi:hypothetical protein
LTFKTIRPIFETVAKKGNKQPQQNIKIMEIKEVIKLNERNKELNIDISYLKELSKSIIKSTKINNTVEPGLHLKYPNADEVNNKIESHCLELAIRQTQQISGQLKQLFDLSCDLKYKAEKLTQDLNRFKFDIKVQETDGADLTY